MQQLARVEKTIAKLKNPPDLDVIPGIPVMREGRVAALLWPVPSDLKGSASDDTRLMSEWRNRHREHSSPGSQRPRTQQRSGSPTRMLPTTRISYS